MQTWRHSCGDWNVSVTRQYIAPLVTLQVHSRSKGNGHLIWQNDVTGMGTRRDVTWRDVTWRGVTWRDVCVPLCSYSATTGNTDFSTLIITLHLGNISASAYCVSLCFQAWWRTWSRKLHILHVRLSGCPHVIAWLPLDRFLWKLVLVTCMKISRENSDVVAIGPKCRALYTKT
jgi:hypothetical protein